MNVKRFLTRLLCLLIVISNVLLLSSCMDGQQKDELCASGHTYSDDCDAVCNVCGERRSVEHAYDDDCDAICNLCGDRREVAHKYSGVCDTVCDICGGERTAEEHTYDDACDAECNVCGDRHIDAHKYDHACDDTCNLCGDKRTIQGHIYDGDCSTKCSACLTPRVPSGSHAYSDDCDRTCNVCGEERSTRHVYTNDEDLICNVCGYTRTEGESIYPWTSEQLIFQMNMNDNDGQLSSMCKKYLEGEMYGGTTINDMVIFRNAMAYVQTKTAIQYEYWSYGAQDGWGASNEKIVTLCKSKDSLAPDMYCSFVYDMVAAMLQGSFANVLSDARGTNYFRFNASDYDASVDDEGYMFEYMTSLTLSDKNAYLIASDYFIDTVRAFFVVPVNIALLESDAAKAVTGGDGSYNTFIKDVVKAKKWDYNRLMQYCEAVRQVNPTSGNYDLNGGIVGWALASDSGLSSSGLIYTTTVKIIERAGSQNYDHKYPEGNEDLVTLSKNIKALMSTQGAVSGGYNNIKAAFTQGRVLFGGIINAGKIEDTEYQMMMTMGGVGILPVPLYRSNTFDKAETDPDYVMDSYRTQIHNNGRIGAIAANTTQFSACTAFLNYQSTHSTGILNEYCEWNLAKSAMGSIEGNLEMLQYLRAHVDSGFDKAFEDAICEYKGLTPWHKAIQEGRYKTTTGIVSTAQGIYKLGEEMGNAYAQLRTAKQMVFDEIRDIFEAAGGFSNN